MNVQYKGREAGENSSRCLWPKLKTSAAWSRFTLLLFVVTLLRSS